MNRDFLIDTNIISAVLKQNRKLSRKIAAVINEDGRNIFVSAVTYFEVKRGLMAVSAAKKMRLFNEMCNDYEILGFDGVPLIDRAAEIYADLRRRGKIIPDNDIMIAATALAHRLILVTDDKHFDRIPGLSVENWLAEAG